ncbi:MAG: Calx-beta domain-containing protein [Verrucomicrobiota bacterium]
MHISLIKRAAVLGASAFAFAASAAFSAEWTSFQIGTLNSYSFTYAHREDGQFILGEGGEIAIQTTYGSPGTTLLANTSNLLLDPAFIAVKSATVGLIGAGGPLATSNLYPFDPSTPGTSISATPLANLQNFSGKYWKHPTSGREGWLVIGGNGTMGGLYGANTLSFVSLDGSKSGKITGDLSAFSGGLDVDALGNVFFALSAFDADEGKILKFTAAQVDAAVLALISDTPAPLSKAAAELIFEADASASLAVDSAGRFWIGGYPLSHIQAYDPVTSVQRRFTPDHAALANAAGSPSYSVRSYNRNGAGFVSFLASDSFYNDGSALTLGYKPVSELNIRSVQFTATAQTVTEAAGTVNLTVTITPALTGKTKVTVPVTVSGTATKGKDYTAIATSLTFDATNTSRSIPVKITNDLEDEDNNNETLILTLGTPAPVAQAGLGAIGTEKFTLTITDDDVKPQIATVQNFGTLKVGSLVNYQVVNTGTAATKWTASGLPLGLKINALTGLITGTPIAAGEYDQVWITATNAQGVSTSIAYVLNVAAFPAPATGTFIGLVDRIGTVTNGLGARVTLVTTSKSTYSGKIEIGKTSVPLKGDLNNAGTHPTASVSFKNGTTNLTLDFALNAVTGELTGSLVPNLPPAPPSPSAAGAAIIDASLSGWRAQTATTLTGVHNFFAAVPGGPASTVPEGTSYGSAKVAATGITTIAGVAADGSVFTSSSPLAINGDLIVYQILYKVPGSFMGVLKIANDTAHTMSGAISWSKPSQGTPTTDKLYATGWNFAQSLAVRGGKYRPAVGATLPMNATASTGNNARIVLQDGGIEALGANPTNILFRIASATSLAVPAPHKLTLKNDTGLLTGSITLGTGVAKKTFNIQALLVPDATTPDPFDSTAEGYFILPVSGTVSRAGMVGIEPIGL